ncbi:hypothetical protein, partial [Brucella sp. 09RB8918]|uniref:hypothetical protein n=1 Tax=Brucella sp. 09RB8918 TaxID=1844048 RepID=UPI0019D4F887
MVRRILIVNNDSTTAMLYSSLVEVEDLASNKVSALLRVIELGKDDFLITHLTHFSYEFLISYSCLRAIALDLTKSLYFRAKWFSEVFILSISS